MFVADQDDMTKEVSRSNRISGDMEMEEEEYEIQFAWDKHAKYLTAQARAMSELRSLIKDFLAITDDDERRLKLAHMEHRMQMDAERLELEKTRLELEVLSKLGDDENTSSEIHVDT